MIESKWQTLTKITANNVNFEQTESPSGGIHTSISAHEPGVYAWVHHQTNNTRIMLHHGLSVTATEHMLPGFDEPVVSIDVKIESGGEQTVTFFNLTATQLIEALEAARMANTPEALAESAQ